MILLFGDTQLQADRPIISNDWDLEIKIGDRVSQMCKTGVWIAEMIALYNPDTIIFLGDVSERQGHLSLFTIYIIKQLSNLWFPKDKKCYSILGNHDIYNPSGTMNTHILFPEHVETVLPNIPIIIDNYILASFSMYLDAYMEALKGSNWDTIITHIPIKGMEFNTGFIETQGIDFSDPIFKNKKAFLGHYHRPDICKISSCEINVVGAPMYYDFRDEWVSNRGIILIDDLGGICSEENPYTKRYVKAEGDSAIEIITDAINLYGIENINIKTTDNEKIIDVFDINKFSSYRVISNKKVQENRVENITINSSFKDDIDMYIDKMDTKLNKNKLKDIAKKAIDRVVC